MSGAADINIKLAANITDFLKGMDAAQRAIVKATKSMREMGENMTKYVSLPLAAVAGLSLKAAGDFERYENALKAVSKSQKDFNEQYANLKVIAKLPGINIEEAIKGSIQLQAVGMTARGAESALKGFANAIAMSGGTSENFAGVLRQFTQMQAKGKIMQQDLTVISEHMPVMSTLMQKAFGTANIEIIRASTSAKEFVERIAEAANALPKVSGGISNAFENMQFTIKGVLATIGDALNKNFNITGMIDKLSASLEKAAEWFATLSPAMQKVIFLVAGLAAAIGPLLLALGYLATTILPLMRTGLVKVTALFSAMSLTVIGVVAAVAALAYSARLVVDNWEVIKNFFSRLWNNVVLIFASNAQKLLEIISDLAAKMGLEIDVTDTVFKRMADSAKKSLDTTPVATFGDVMTGFKNTVVKDLTAIKSWFDSTTQSVQHFGGEGAKAAQQVGKAVGSFSGLTGAKLRRYYKPLQSDQQLNPIATGGDPEVKDTTVMEAPEDNMTLMLDSMGEKLNNFALEYGKFFNRIGQSIQDAMRAGFGAVNQLLANSSVNLDNYYKKEQDQIANSNMSAEAKAAATKRLDEEVLKKKREIARKQAITDKASAMLGAVVNTAQAITKALTAGPIAGPILGAIIGAMGAVQIGAIASAPIPALAEGGLAFGETYAMIGDNPRANIDPEVVSPLSKLRDYMPQNGQAQSVEVYGVLRGEDLYLSSKNYQNKRLRGGA
jgi:tape measure domain-containing protein